ncbi:MAG TPA: glycosyltransferase family 9 protein [Opitutaceae bacterium]|nr:glycosyltransferase family 9 protein [Opitutaceae bacterium]
MKRFSSRADILQWIDRRVGPPVCFLLTMARRICDLFGRRSLAAPWRSVVFLKLTEQGSTVLAHEAVRRAVARAGRENVYFLVFEENRFIVDLLGLVPPGNVLTLETRSAWSMAASCWRRLRAIRRQRLDACVDMEAFARFPAAIAYLTGARRRVGFHAYYGEGPYRGDLLTHRLLYNPHLHTSQTFTSLVLALDVDPKQLPTLPIVLPPPPALPSFCATPQERTEAQQLIARAGVPADQRLILLNANAGDLLPLRRWPGENYVALARRLLEEFADVAVAFTGTSDEMQRCVELVQTVASPRCFSLAGRTTLRQLVVLFGLAEVLVTNDSGPAHFAALTEIDVVSLFGPETPRLYAAPGSRNHALWTGLACSPCINAFNNRQTACRDNLCMQMITVDQVFDIVGLIFRRRTAARAAPPASGPPVP